MIYNNDKETKKLEKEAYKLNPKETENLNSYYYGDFNHRTGDMNIYCYEQNLKKIIDEAEEKLKFCLNEIQFLKLMKAMGFEVIKANTGEIALNNKENTLPCVMINDTTYLSPTPFQWYDIDEEIKRFEVKEKVNEAN